MDPPISKFSPSISKKIFSAIVAISIALFFLYMYQPDVYSKGLYWVVLGPFIVIWVIWSVAKGPYLKLEKDELILRWESNYSPLLHFNRSNISAFKKLPMCARVFGYCVGFDLINPKELDMDNVHMSGTHIVNRKFLGADVPMYTGRYPFGSSIMQGMDTDSFVAYLNHWENE